MLINSISTSVIPSSSLMAWPYTVPSIRHIVSNGLTFTAPITVIVGANGSGKSTIVEAIADAYGIDSRGGHGGRKYAASSNQGPLGRVLQLHRTTEGMRYTGRSAKGFFLRAQTAYGMLTFMTDMGVAGYGDRSATKVSHGESYMQAITGRFTSHGLYLLDEAEGPLSFESTLALVYRLTEMARQSDVQIIYATHSPVIAAIPGAQILQLTEDGVRELPWDDLELVRYWRSFLSNPNRFFATGNGSLESP